MRFIRHDTILMTILNVIVTLFIYNLQELVTIVPKIFPESHLLQ